jgi:hypothetical protein
VRWGKLSHVLNSHVAAVVFLLFSTAGIVMDPLTSSIGLLTSIAQLSIYITTFVRGVRDARQDMDAVLRELKSLELCLETLRDDCSDPKVQYPPRVKQMLTGTMSNCDQVTKEMTALLTTVSPGGLSAVRWTITASGDMNKLRSSLAAHKQAIDIALEMWTLYVADLYRLSACA